MLELRLGRHFDLSSPLIFSPLADGLGLFLLSRSNPSSGTSFLGFVWRR
nr:MAG TPA: hypothetical protein [Caudoviricetes sp.]